MTLQSLFKEYPAPKLADKIAKTSLKDDLEAKQKL